METNKKFHIKIFFFFMKGILKSIAFIKGDVFFLAHALWSSLSTTRNKQISTELEKKV